ncbi:ribulose-phosphate 3-epimerase [Candidatus Woesearchaeota archaeon]|nr:MAG: ribulose-phosphate 3-epimerase [Candidatus Woesearchaeota archaeon]
MKKIIGAIIAKNQDELDKLISKEKGYVDGIQLDIIDGKFADNESLNFDFLIKDNVSTEAHLMVEDPVSWIKKNSDKVETVIIHYESNYFGNALKLARRKGKKVGLALKISTPVDKIRDYLERVDQVLIMSVELGFYGGRFVPEALEKVKEIKRINPELKVEVDGGINDKTIRMAAEAGADLFVVGSYLANSKNVKDDVKNLRKHLK